MVKLSDIAKLLKSEQEQTELDGLAASFKEMVDMRRHVPYLKDFKFNQTSHQSGDARSSFKGRGIEFEEVRSYNFGDDVRDIDWRVTARRNEPYTKLYAEEKDREVFVWLDLSEIMRFGTKNELKSVTAAKIAALLGWFTLENKDRFGLAVFDGEQTHIFQAKRNQDHLLSLLKKIEQISIRTLYEQDNKSKREKSLLLLQQKLHQKSILFIISSFEEFEQDLRRTISGLSGRNELYLVNIYDALEASAPPRGEYLAQYKQNRQLLISRGTKFADAYAAHFQQKREDLKLFCAKFNCRYREVRTDLPIYAQLKPI